MKLATAGLLLLMASCTKADRADGYVFIVRVDGMKRGSGGKTWMAWPESVKKALEGLAGVAKVEMDLDRDLFRVTLRDATVRDAVFAAIRDLGYTPSPADAGAFRETAEPTHPTGDAPELVRKACERARAEKKLVLVDCMGDSWVACRNMSVKTFADPEVRKIVEERFVFVEINVDRQQEAAGWFKGEAIPDTWVLSAEGRMLDRVVGFMEPREFAARLNRILERR